MKDKKMTKHKIRIVTFGGKIGWFLRKHFSRFTSSLYLNSQYLLRRPLYNKYINFFNKNQKENNYSLPCLISLETINRCNSNCSFCPANKNYDKRPFEQMSEELFKKIISELKELNFGGYLNLYVNNEPFMDSRIEDWYKYAKQQLPNAKMLLYTNGTMLTIDRFVKIAPYIDKMIINNYSKKLVLHPIIKKLYDFIKENPLYSYKDITIQIRYVKEILTNRAGFAPNKMKKKYNNQVCIMPYTDFTIYPNGKVGLCCNDTQEKTCLGDVTQNTLYEIWTSTAYKDIRSKLASGRNNHAFCQGCDFIDAGIRNTLIKETTKKFKEKEQ